MFLPFYAWLALCVAAATAGALQAARLYEGGAVRMDRLQWTSVPVEGGVLGEKRGGVTVELTPSSFYSELSRGFWLIKFFSPQCSHCVHLQPVWDSAVKMAMNYTDIYSFYFGSVDCLAYRLLCKDAGIKYVPTILYYKNSARKEELNLGHISQRTIEKILSFVKDKLRNEAPIATKVDSSTSTPTSNPTRPPDRPSIPINKNGVSVFIASRNFTSLVVNQNNGWLILFYSPSCPHCVEMASDWKRLAGSLKGELNVGKINCEAEGALCSKLSVSSVPAIFYYKGPYNIRYRDSRNYRGLRIFSWKILLSNAVEVNSLKTYEEYYSKYPAFFIYVCPNEDRYDTDILRWMSVVLIGKAPLLKITDASILSRFLLIKQYPSLLVIRDNRVSYYSRDLKDPRNRQSIFLWLRSVWLPVFPELTIINIDEIMKKSVVVIVVFYQSHEPKQKIGLIKEIVRQWERTHPTSIQKFQQDPYSNSIQFTWVNGTSWKNWIYRKYKVQKVGSEPKVIFHKSHDKQHWSKNADGSYIRLDKEKILSILEVITKHKKKEPKKPDTPTGRKDSNKKRYYIAIAIYVVTVVLLIVSLVFVLKKIRKWKRKKAITDKNEFLVSRFD